MDENKDILLKVSHLCVDFQTDDAVLKAVEDVSFDVRRGETLGIVGESGCGKSISCMSILRLILAENVKYAGGEILFEGEDTLTMPERQLRKLRGKEISVIFQEPMTALNPLYTVGDQMSEALRLHEKITKKAALDRCEEYLGKVRIPNPRAVLCRYPHSLSGGMRQRVMIAMALITDPKLVIADEPTTALDVTIQAQVLELMKALQTELSCSYIFITHDLGVISEMADRVVVMYGGRVCECADTDALFEHPEHPYTRGLIASRPGRDTDSPRLTVIPGSVPSLNNKPTGCPFHPRCPLATERCAAEFPETVDTGGGHTVACWNAGEVKAQS
jgi:oligopeptide/dipeptide ABC transporter ATP-binding protein